MKAIVNINIRSKADRNYVDHSGYRIVDIDADAFGKLERDVYTSYTLERDVYTSYTLERLAIEEVLKDIAYKKWVALYGDIIDLELGAVMVNLEQYDAIDVDVCLVMTDDEFRQFYLGSLEKRERKAARALAESSIKEDK